MLHTAAFSLVLFSWLGEIGEILLLICLSGEVALLVLEIFKGRLERRTIAFAVLVLLGCSLERADRSQRALLRVRQNEGPSRN